MVKLSDVSEERTYSIWRVTNLVSEDASSIQSRQLSVWRLRQHFPLNFEKFNHYPVRELKRNNCCCMYFWYRIAFLLLLLLLLKTPPPFQCSLLCSAGDYEKVFPTLEDHTVISEAATCFGARAGYTCFRNSQSLNGLLCTEILVRSRDVRLQYSKNYNKLVVVKCVVLSACCIICLFLCHFSAK
jgi:hypothetical protein